MINEEKRLRIVLSVVELTHEMRDAGFQKTAYSRILRETIYFVWEVRELSKYSKMRKRSKAAEGLPPRELDYDHAVPMRVVTEMILNTWPNREAIRMILTNLVHGILITKAEHALLRKKGLSSRMPDDWNGQDWTARYKSAGICLAA